MSVRFAVAFHEHDGAILYFRTEHGPMHIPAPLMEPPMPGTAFTCSLEESAAISPDPAVRKEALNRLIGGQGEHKNAPLPSAWP